MRSRREARALALAGRNEEALAEIDTVIARFLADGSAADSFEVQRAQRYRARISGAGRPRCGSLDTCLRDLRDRHSGGKGSPVERGLVLDALGEAERQSRKR